MGGVWKQQLGDPHQQLLTAVPAVDVAAETEISQSTILPTTNKSNNASFHCQIFTQ